jgi:catechol 2,3-dioxygenase-like lactoylglutathione lyase family enzyme
VDESTESGFWNTDEGTSRGPSGRRYTAAMAFHHLALAARDMPAIDRFYREAMGFALERVVIARTPEGGWAKHFFYDAGDGELMAFWELHDEDIGDDFETGLSEAAGLPPWVNHVAFRAGSIEDLERRRDHWLACGYDVLDIDHGWCHSIYTTDPNRTLVEWCCTTGAATGADRERARRAVTRDDLPFDAEQARVRVHTSPHDPLHER